MRSLFNVPSSILGVGIRAWAKTGHPPARPNAWVVQQSHWGQALVCRANLMSTARGARR